MSKDHMNYLRRKTADEAELWAADRIEELEGANILNSNALRLQKKKCDALLADNARMLDAIDQEMVTTNLGTFEAGDDPVKAIHELMCWSQGVGEYFATDKIAQLEAERYENLAQIEHLRARIADLISEVTKADNALSEGDRNKALIGVRMSATAASLVEQALAATQPKEFT